jgi:CO/xanthine dehydrogenase FAD-binding subunit
VQTPRSLEAALAAWADMEPGARVVAGGTDLMVALHAGVLEASTLLDLWKVRELAGISEDGGWLELGALTTYTDLIESGLVRRRLPALVEAAATVGAVQIQNRGTVGGNLANASPAADLAPVFSALDALVVLASRARGVRQVSIHDFFLGYRRTCLEPGELLTAVRVPLPPPGEQVVFRKVGTRRAQAISKVVLAAALSVAGKRLTRIRVAAGSVAPTVVRLRRAEAALGGASLPVSSEAVQAAVAGDVSPIDDVRSTAAYRRQVVGNILWRFLQQ